MSLLIVGTDATIVNVALPAIGHGLHASLSDLQWTVDAYTLVIGSLLMASGSTADRFGRRRVFQTGLAEEFHQALRGQGCEATLLRVEQRNHSSILFRAIEREDPVARAMVAFIRRHAEGN